MNPAVWSSRFKENRLHRSTWAGEQRLTEPWTLQMPRRVEKKLR